MNFPEVKSREEFAEFVKALAVDYQSSIAEWENVSVPDFLEALGAWVKDRDVSASPDAWGVMAQLLYAGSRYE